MPKVQSGPYIPPRILPQNKISFKKYNQHQWKQPLPPEYKKSAKALQEININKVSLETIIPKKKRFFHEINKLVVTATQRASEINYLLQKFEILENNKFLNEWMARILIGELLWGKQQLKSAAKEVEAIKYYEEDLREAYTEVIDITCNPLDNHKFKFPTYVRINILSITIEDTLNAFGKEGWNLLPRCTTYSEYLKVLKNLRGKNFIRDYHISELLAFPPGTILYFHPGYLKGKFLIQDKGSCLSSFLLNPKPDSNVLDICAARGIKTNHLANIMNNEGLIYANDIHPVRFNAMCNILKLTGATCVKPLLDDYLNLKLDNSEDIKYILIDATSTYSGIFYEVNKVAHNKRLKSNQFILSMVLRYILQTFTNVKRVVFTTCSLYPEEGEKIVDDALKEVGDSYTLLDVKEMLWNQWETVGVSEYICGNKCLRTMPEFDLCQGYFIAVFERNFNVSVPAYVRRFKKNSKVCTFDDLEKIEKINHTGKIIQAYVPKDKNMRTEEEERAILERKMNQIEQRKIKNISFKMKKELKQFKKLNQYSNTSSTSDVDNFPSQDIYETTHDQLYP